MRPFLLQTIAIKGAHMKYQRIKDYKYRLHKTLVVQTHILNAGFEHTFFTLKDDGRLAIHEGYLWDGVSGPTWDTRTTMLAGLVHDALYQAIRLQLIDLSLKDTADILLHTIMVNSGKHSGTPEFIYQTRAWYFYQAVRLFGKYSCIPGDIHIPEVIVV